MRQKIQRLLLFSVGMSSLVLVSEPMIPSILPALAVAGQTAQTSQVVATPQASPMQTQPSSTPLRRLTSEIPGLRQLVAPSIAISPPPSPTLIVNPTGVTFSGVQGGANPASKSIAVTSNGKWEASSSVPWLTLSPSSGNGNGSMAANVTLASLASPVVVVGPNQATITVTSGGVTRTATVTLTVTAPLPTLTVNPIEVTFSGVQGGANPASESVTVTANGKWEASSSVPWLTLSPSSGNGNGSMAANVTLASPVVVVGPNQATITVTSGGVTRTATVKFTVATLTAEPSSLTYTATKGAADPAEKTITVSASGAWTASSSVPWLTLKPSSGKGNGSLAANVTLASPAVAVGPNQATITVTSGGISRTVNVTLTLNPQASSSVTLTWKANTESDLAGYKVYRATSSGAYGAPIAAIPGNTTSYTATGLQLNTTYFFVITAYDIAGNESAFSNEVSKSVY
jgi:hypothetical protein